MYGCQLSSSVNEFDDGWMQKESIDGKLNQDAVTVND